MLQLHNSNERSYAHAIIAYVAFGSNRHIEKVAYLARAMPECRVLAVADSLTATQAQMLERLFADLDNLSTLNLDVPLGKGAAMRAGLNEANSPAIALIDLDGDLELEEIEAAFDRLESDERIDAVVGNRWDKDSKVAAPLFRRVSSRTFDLFARALFGLGVRDPQSPLKVFRRRALLRVFEDLRLYNHGFDVELMFQARRAKLRVRELPIVWRAADHTWPILRTAAGAILALIMVRLLNSPLSRLWLLDSIGRRYSLPVKRSYSIMIFCWRDPRNPLSGGGEVYLHEQARCWVKAGHRVTWFAQRFSGAPAEEDFEGIRVVRWGRFPFVFLLGAIWYLFKSDKRYDFIIDCMNGIPFFTPLFSTKPKVCLIYHVHSHHFKEELPPVIRDIACAVETKLTPLLYQRTRFLTISESTRSEMMRVGMSRSPIGIIHSGVDKRLVPGMKSEHPTVLYLGRLKKYKRVRKLIDAFAVLKASEVPDAELIIAGTGDDESALREYADAKGCGGIVFTGRVDDDEKVRLMQAAWAFGMPSSIEGWGIVVIEANACATPAVVYNVSGLRDCVVDRETGFIAETDAEFCEGLRTLLTNASLRERISSSALEWSLNYSWESAAAKTLRQIRQSQPWRAVFEPNDRDAWALSELRSPFPTSVMDDAKIT